jgi:hypothetical protein
MQKLFLVLLFSATVLSTFQSYVNNNSSFYYIEGQIQTQKLPQQQVAPSLLQPAVGVKITSPTTNQNVSTGQLTITGTSTDTPTSECQVYVDWNDRKPYQRAIAAGSAGNGDYSKWNHTYTAPYNEITNGTNELTSKISCLASPTNLTKWYSINVTGIEGLVPQTDSYLPSITQVQSNSTSNSTNFVSPLSTISAAQINPPVTDSEDSEDDDNEDEDSDKDMEVEEAQEEEENSGEAADVDVLNDDSNNEVMEEEEEDNGNAELFVTNEDNPDEEEEGAAANDNIEVVDEEEDESNGDVDNELIPDRGDEEEEGAAANDNIEVVDEEEDESNGDVDNELIPDRGDEEEEIAPPRNLEPEEKEEEESDTNSLDIPSELSPSTIPSSPLLSEPTQDELEQNEDGDDCDIDDAGFPFCDGRRD